MEPTIIALLGIVLGGAGKTIIDFFLNHPRELRSELRAEVDRLRDDLKEADQEVDKWRDLYYTLRENMLKGETNDLDRIRADLDVLLEQRRGRHFDPETG